MEEDNSAFRAKSADVIRKEAIRRWEQDDSEEENEEYGGRKMTVQFDHGTVLLSAISADDIDDLKDLLSTGIDINFRNVDGLTALHQACINENLDMVQLLVENGADMDAQDNEGWTALHAVASSGLIDIAEYLVESGADVSVPNTDGDLPINLAESDKMKNLFRKQIEKKKISVENSRKIEERIMMEDVTRWMISRPENIPIDWQGGTPVHVAAAKGYCSVLQALIQAGLDINVKDKDGWTPLHAAAHWEQQAACEILAAAGSRFDATSRLGETPLEICSEDFSRILEEIQKKQQISLEAVQSRNQATPPAFKRRTSISRIKDRDLSFADKAKERMTLESVIDERLLNASEQPSIVAAKPNMRLRIMIDDHQELEEKQTKPPTTRKGGVELKPIAMPDPITREVVKLLSSREIPVNASMEPDANRKPPGRKSEAEDSKESQPHMSAHSTWEGQRSTSIMVFPATEAKNLSHSGDSDSDFTDISTQDFGTSASGSRQSRPNLVRQLATDEDDREGHATRTLRISLPFTKDPFNGQGSRSMDLIPKEGLTRRQVSLPSTKIHESSELSHQTPRVGPPSICSVDDEVAVEPVLKPRRERRQRQESGDCSKSVDTSMPDTSMIFGVKGEIDRGETSTTWQPRLSASGRNPISHSLSNLERVETVSFEQKSNGGYAASAQQSTAPTTIRVRRDRYRIPSDSEGDLPADKAVGDGKKGHFDSSKEDHHQTQSERSPTTASIASYRHQLRIVLN